jgi:hypothetical protein
LAFIQPEPILGGSSSSLAEALANGGIVFDKFDRVAPGSIGTYSGPQANAFNGAQAVAAEADRVVATYGNSLTFGPTRNRGWHSIAKSLGFRLLETFELPAAEGRN